MAKGNRGGKRAKNKFYVTPPKNNALDRNKSYEVKPWFANKVANEVKRNIPYCDVFAVLEEREKAVYAILNIGSYKMKTMWIPKAALEKFDVGMKSDQNKYHYQTNFISNYDAAVKKLKSHWSDFR